MTKKNFSLCSPDPEIRKHFEFKYAMLAKALTEQKDYETYCRQMEKEMDDYINQIDQDDLINQ